MELHFKKLYNATCAQNIKCQRHCLRKLKLDKKPGFSETNDILAVNEPIRVIL